MSIERINAAQQVANTQQKEFTREDEIKTQVQTKGNTKDVIATLGILASIGIAAVAIIKSKNAKKELQEALKKAEEEKKKLAEEAKKAAEEAKKAAENVNKTVDKAKKEMKYSVPKSGGRKASGGGSGRTRYEARKETPVAEAPKTKTPKVEEPKVEAPKVEEPKTETPVAEAPKTETPKVEVPKTEVPKVEEPVTEVPQAEVKPQPIRQPKDPNPQPATEVKQETIVETPKAGEPKVEAPKTETPKVEEPTPVQESAAEVKPEKSEEVIKQENTLDEGTKEGLEIIEKQEAAAKRAIEESDARNAEWVAEQNAKREAEYEKMYIEAERKYALENGGKELEGGHFDIFLDEVSKDYTKQLEEAQNGIIFIPRATKLSDYLSEKFGKLRNKFTGFFGKKKTAASTEKPFEPSSEGVNAWLEKLRADDIEKGKQEKEKVKKQLQDNSNTIPIKEFIDSSIPKKHNKHYHNKIQKQYDKMAEELKKQEAESIQDGLKYLDEQEAAAKRAIEESNARNAKWVAEQNAKREAEYEKMFLDAEAEYNAKKEAKSIIKENALKDAPAINTTVEHDIANGVGNEIATGKNQLPESFNQEQLKWLRANNLLMKDRSVLKYPKLYSGTHGKIEIPIKVLSKNQIEFFTSNGYIQNGDVLVLDVSESLPKNEKALRKLMKKLDNIHKSRRIHYASEKYGIHNESVLYNPICVPKDSKYNYRKYRSMELERLNDADWEPEMTREELMQNIEKYINEEIARTQVRHSSAHKKQTLWEKIKNKIGL